MQKPCSILLWNACILHIYVCHIFHVCMRVFHANSVKDVVNMYSFEKMCFSWKNLTIFYIFSSESGLYLYLNDSDLKNDFVNFLSHYVNNL